MSDRTLSTRELNRALLARQLLLERSKLSLTRAIDRVGGLQTQYSPSGYVGLWSRLEKFERDALTKALERRRVVQATMMRVTIHMVSATDYWPLTEGFRKARQEWWMGLYRKELDERSMREVAKLVRKELKAAPRRHLDMVKVVQAAGYPRSAWNGVGLFVDLVRVPPSGTWDRRRADLFGLAEDWLGPSNATETEGLELLVRRYLGAFGPARESDIATWAGMPPTKIRPTIEKMTLRRFRDEEGKELLDLPRSPLPDADTPAPVRFLPHWDANLLVHARRTQILPERFRSLIFNTKSPQSFATFLVEGQVAGKWAFKDGRMELDPFERLPRSVTKELKDEADRLLELFRD